MSVEAEILDQLTAKPTSYLLLSNQKPPFRSDAARKIDAGFKYKGTGPDPMVYSSEAGLVLYERVVTGHQEDQMLRKLAKPKAIRAHAPVSKPVLSNIVVPTAMRSGGSLTSASAGTAASHGLRPSASMSALDAQGGPASPRSGQAGPGPSSSSMAAATGSLYTPGRKNYAKGLRSQHDVDKAIARDRYQKERSTMTAAHVFTWGGRFRFQPPTQATPGMQWSPGLQRSPLRLDAFVDD